MTRVRLIHWNQAEGLARAERLRHAGFVVDAEPLQTTGTMKSLRDDLPHAFVIDLSRLPSHGSAIAMALRQSKATRSVPLIFATGDAAKTQRVRDMVPDATFTTWERMARDLRHAIAHPPRAPVVPRSSSGAYSGTPLPKKLGIKQNSLVGLIGAPKDFDKTLGRLPLGSRLVRQPRSACHVVLCFARTMKQMQPRMRKAMTLAADSGLWLIWPKKSSGVATDLSEEVVRKAGLAAGWVDYKVCAVDATWSGHKFARRRAARE